VSSEKRLHGRGSHLDIDSLKKLKVMERWIFLKEVPRSLVGLLDFKSSVGR
jgi:hypothetical protein